MSTVIETTASAENAAEHERPHSVEQPTTAIAGPEGHPFHPMLVTIPIGAWVCSLAFDIGGSLSKDPVTFGRGAMWLLVIGVAGALVAAAFGLMDLRGIPRNTKARATAMAHLTLNSVAVVIFAVNAWLRDADWKPPFETRWWGFTLSIVGLLIVGASGYLGGKLAYHYGVRMAGATKQSEGY